MARLKPDKPRERLSPAAVDAFRRRDRRALHDALGLKPWQINPLDVDDGPSPWPAGAAGAIHWPHAQELRHALEAAVKGQ